jgi:23S rRNA pseudouridine955/2504/2580 synthase
MVSAVESRTVKEGEAGMRLDRWFRAHFPQIRHGELEKLLRTGQVRVGGGRVKANRRLEPGEEVRIPPLRATPPAPAPSRPRPEDATFLRSIALYEDDAILALNKPAGLPVQGGEKASRHIDGMLDAFAVNGERPRLVHRLDRDTSGLLLLAKTRAAAAALSESFRRHEVEKTYWALVAGSPRPRAGTIDLALIKRRNAASEERVAPAEDEGKSAVTDYQVVEEAGTVSFLALRPRTGRTHQLRVHCAALGTPIVGDGKYGGAKARIEGVAPTLHLFCRSMTFPHPAAGRTMTLSSPLSGPMLETWKFFDFPVDAEVDWPEAAR